MKKILFIVGSLRRNSFNRQMAKKAEAFLAGKVEVRYLDYSDLPFMNQDIEFPAPAAVARVREETAAADGVWIFTPEYNYSYPGALKNLLDWLSRPFKPNDYASPTAISGKKVAICGAAGKSECANSIGKLLPLLEMLRTEPMKEPLTHIAIPPEAWQTDRLTLTEEQLNALQAQAAAFLTMLG